MTPEQVAARARFLDDEDDGWAGAFLIEPLTALAGGILGGVAVAAISWRIVWAVLEARAGQQAMLLARRLG